MKAAENFILGTWQLSGDFHKQHHANSVKLIESALEFGVYQFDTANVYGMGEVESLLGTILPHSSIVITKIPSKIKLGPYDTIEFNECYSIDAFSKQLGLSIDRLKRIPNTVLFHNWSTYWENQRVYETIQAFREVTEKLGVKKLGISLPNKYGKNIPNQLGKIVNFFEMPCNLDEPWVTPKLINQLKNDNCPVVLRSLFKHGLLTMSEKQMQNLEPEDKRYEMRSKYQKICDQSPSKIIKEIAVKYRCPLVIGARTPDQIKQNVLSLEEAV